MLHLTNPVLEQFQRLSEVVPPLCQETCPFPELTGIPRDCVRCHQYEVVAGSLACRECGTLYPIEGGIPHCLVSLTQDSRKRTASSYSYLWKQSSGSREDRDPPIYHFDHIQESLLLEAPKGLVLDAGCGGGIDLAHQASRQGVEAIGVDLSDGGCQASFRRTWELPTAHVVQADLSRLPFEDETFDVVYSYGVLHHLESPEGGLRELVRVVKSGGQLAVYLYEDFGERAAGWRWLLAIVNYIRHLTPRIPHRILYRFCQFAAPVVYLIFTVPSKVLRHVRWLRSFAESLPFRHGAGPFSLAGDLYDRFSTPIERRYSRSGALQFLAAGGLQDVVIAYERGWMVAGRKPGSLVHAS